MARVALIRRDTAGEGGAEAALLTLADFLREEHRVEVFEAPVPHFGSRFVPTELRKLRQWTLTIARARASFREVRDFDPDLVLSQHEGAWIGARIDAPHVVLVHDTLLCGRRYLDGLAERSVLAPGLSDYDPLHVHVAKKASYVAGQTVNRLLRPVNRFFSRRVLGGTDFVVACCQHLAALHREFGVEAAVVYPFIDLDEYRTETSGNEILHVGPSYLKGIDVTLEVARHLPEYDFRVVGSSPPGDVRARMNQLDNVRYHGYEDDLRSVYASAKFLLVPSWIDAFPRVTVEAGVSGIPPIVSGKGGLPETVPSREFVAASNTPEAYVRAIRRMEEDYERYSREVESHASSFGARSEFAKLTDVVERRLGIDL